MAKFVSFKKSTHKLLSWKEILSWIIWDFSIIQQKHDLICLGLYRLIFQSLYHTSLISSKRQVDETVNFQNFRKLFKKNLLLFCGILAPIFKWEKGNEVTGHKKNAAMAVTCILQWGSWCSCKIVIIKMNKMLCLQVIVFWMFTALCFSNDFGDFEGFLMPSIGGYTQS